MNINEALVSDSLAVIDELRQEIISLRKENQFLALKAEAYDALVTALGARGKLPNGMREDPLRFAERTAHKLSKAISNQPQRPKDEEGPAPAEPLEP